MPSTNLCWKEKQGKHNNSYQSGQEMTHLVTRRAELSAILLTKQINKIMKKFHFNGHIEDFYVPTETSLCGNGFFWSFFIPRYCSGCNCFWLKWMILTSVILFPVDSQDRTQISRQTQDRINSVFAGYTEVVLRMS